MEDTITLKVVLVQQLANYLITKPWGEVNSFLNEIQLASQQSKNTNVDVAK